MIAMTYRQRSKGVDGYALDKLQTRYLAKPYLRVTAVPLYQLILGHGCNSFPAPEKLSCTAIHY